MANLSRRSFFRKTSTGVTSLGMLAVLPGLGATTNTKNNSSNVSEALKVELTDQELGAVPLIAHILDASTGEIALMVGTKEVICKDPDLVQRLLKAAI